MVDSISNILPINIVGVVSGTLASGTPTNIFSRAAIQNVVIINEDAISVEIVGSGGGGGGGLDNVVEDTTPQLGGNLDAQNNNITGGTGTLSYGTGIFATSLTISGVPVPLNVGIQSVGEDTNPQLGGDLDAETFDIVGVGVLESVTGTFSKITAVTGTFTEGLTIGTGSTHIFPEEIRVNDLTVSGSGDFSQGLTVSGTPVNIGESGGGGASARTYTASNGGTDQTVSGTTETIITGLGNIAVPGTPDGAKNYRLNCVVPFIAGEESWGYADKPTSGALTVLPGASMSSGADTSLALATSVSCFVWWQPTDETENTDGEIFGAYQTGLDQNTIQLSYDKGVGAYQARITHDLSTNAKRYHYTGLSQVIGEWIHIGFTYLNADGLRLYVNGKEHPATQTEDNTVSQTNNDDRHVVICQNELTVTSGAGNIHSAGMWAAKMAAKEVASLYNAGRGDLSDWDRRFGDYVSDAPLRFYYRFGAESNAFFGEDRTANGVDLSTDGTPTLDNTDVSDLFFATPRLTVHMGATGDLTDAVVYSTPIGQSPLTINGLQVTPALGDKITLGFRGNGGGNIIHLGEQIAGQFSFLEIEEI
jgi:hypothetical protein